MHSCRGFVGQNVEGVREELLPCWGCDADFLYVGLCLTDCTGLVRDE